MERQTSHTSHTPDTLTTVSEGERYLALLGLSDIAEDPIPSHPDKKVREFLDICGNHARPVLKGLASLSPTDPRFISSRDAVRTMVLQMLAPRG